MGREKDRKLRRRQRRKRKLQNLKNKLALSTKLEDRHHLVEKIKRISLNPKQDIPEKYHDLLEF